MQRAVRMSLSALLFFSVMRLIHATPSQAPPTIQSEPQCVNWGVYESEAVSVYEGEAGRIRCPLFSHPKLYNYAETQSTGHTLLWYRHTEEQEEPVDLSLPTFIKQRDALWIQPASTQDRGEYICILRNISSCVKIGVQLDVVPREGDCHNMVHRNISVPLQTNYTLRCPDVQNLPNKTYSLAWFHNCERKSFNVRFEDDFRAARNNELIIYQMFVHFAGTYTCVATYQSNGQTFNYTHTVILRAVSNSWPKDPKILNPASDELYSVSVGKTARFPCRVFLPYLNDDEPQVWWSVNNKTLEDLSEPRYTSPAPKVLLDDFGDRNVERVLIVSPFKDDDLHKEFRCSVQNSKGFNSRAATLKEEVYIPSVELGCGLGVTLVLALLLFVLYRVFWLEVHLLYRSWFGTDERDTDNKEYDVYISYARNTEEEEFVMATLRRVLETEFGYTVCIFDRDSLPGGTVTEETLQFVSRSRRLLVILSACSAFRDAQALLEVRAGVSAMLRGGNVKLVLVQFPTRVTRGKSRKRDTHKCVKELHRARIALALVQWEGDKSTSLTSRFWKNLRLQLPLRKPSNMTKPPHDTSRHDCTQKSENTLLMLESLHTPNATSLNSTPTEHIDLAESVLRCMQASRRLVVVLSGPCVCEKSVQKLECGLCVYLHGTCGIPLITVRWRRTLRTPCCRELAELRRCAICVHWHGARSQHPTSRFWKRLRLALPVRPLALGPRLIDSTSSHSDLAAVALRRTHTHTRAHLHKGGDRAHGCALCVNDSKLGNNKQNGTTQSTNC